MLSTEANARAQTNALLSQLLPGIDPRDAAAEFKARYRRSHEIYRHAERYEQAEATNDPIAALQATRAIVAAIEILNAPPPPPPPVPDGVQRLAREMHSDASNAVGGLKLRASLWRAVATESQSLTHDGDTSPRARRLIAIILGSGAVKDPSELIGPRAPVAQVRGPIASWVESIGTALGVTGATDEKYVRAIVAKLDSVIDRLAANGRWLELHASLQLREHLISAGIRLIGHPEIESTALVWVELVGRHLSQGTAS